MKKVFKIIGITLLIFLLILFAIPFVLQSQIETIVQRYTDENLNAKVSFSSVTLSLIKSFPNAQVDINDLAITTYKPFEGETLAISKSISLTMPIAEVFKSSGDEALIINNIYVDETLLTLKTNKLGDVNYDILKPSKNSDQDLSDSSGFTFDVQDYRIENSALTYIDETNNTTFYITEFNHIGKGTFSGEISELDTETDARLSLTIDSTNYLNNNTLKLDALIDLDLANNKYTFKENKGFINDLLLEFNGFVQQVENGQQFDLSFQNPGASFKDFLAVVPSGYSQSIENVDTEGDFKVNGLIKGLLSEETIPELDINIVSRNASFKYPDLPKRVEDITINAALKNTTGNPEDTYIQIDNFNFKIDADTFKSSATLKNISENMLVNAHIDGTLNLVNITKAYPVKLDKELSGILKANVNTAFDMHAIETNAYDRIKNNGTASITDFIFSSEDIVNPIHIKSAQMSFNPGTVSLNSFDAISGNSDIAATGNITNLLGFLLSDKNLKGNFNVTSKKFLVSDFMVADENSEKGNKATAEGTPLKIPAFLDCTINANAQHVIYDNLNLKNVKGNLIIRDQTASLQNLTSDIFEGKLTLDGRVNTNEKTAFFNINLGANGFDIAQSFTDLDLFKALAPMAKVLNGKLNSSINVSGDLNESFSPNLQTVSGNAAAELLTIQLQSENSQILTALEDQIRFVDFNKLNLKNLKTSLTFENGGVNVKPFFLKYEDIDIAIAGTHRFDKTMDYNVVFNVPAKYLGSDVNRMIGQINDPAVNKISIPVTANLTGSFTNPQVKTDLSSGIANLTKQLIEIQKQKLLQQGENTVKDILGDILLDNTNNSQTTQDSTSTGTQTNTQQTIKNILGNILINKKKNDSLN